MWIIDKLIYATTKAKQREQLIDEANNNLQRAETYEDTTDILIQSNYDLQHYAIDLEFSLMCAILALPIVVVSFIMGVWL